MKYYAHSTNSAGKLHLLADHLKETARLAGEFAKHFGDGAEVLTRQAGLLHDLGKYSEQFQQKLEGVKDRVDHATHGAKVAIEQFGDLGYFLAYAIAGHHAGLSNGTGFDGKRSSLEQRLANKDLPELAEIWQQEVKLANPKDLCPVLANIKLCKEHKIFQCAFLIRMLFSCLIDADRLDTEKFYQPQKTRDFEVSLTELQAKLDKYLQSFIAKGGELNERRNNILKTARSNADFDRGVFSLTVPTGGGKTLTSLAFALDHAIKQNLRRVIYVIPYTNIIEQTAEVFREALGSHKDCVLEHHSGFVIDSEKASSEFYQGQDKLKLAMENWQAPIIVTTAVQFFESLFANRPSSCRKLHNIANSVIILDEVQTTPLRVLHPCMVALQELVANYRSSIVLCTATQPALSSKKFTGGFKNMRELVPDPNRQMFSFFRRTTIESEIKKWDDSTLLQKIRNQQQVLCIVNNRKHARFLVDNLNDCSTVKLLTTLMCAKHRQKVLKEIHADLLANRPCRVVATSLVEAGVDLDFPTVFRAEAGLDSIIQAAGRCNREGKRDKNDSMVYIFQPTNQKWSPPHELQQFAQVMRGCLRREHDLLSLNTIENYFRELYWRKGKEYLDQKGILKSFQEAKLQSLPFEKIAKDFVMIEDNQRPVIVAYDDCAKKLIDQLSCAEKCGELVRKMQSYLVQAPKDSYQKMLTDGQLEFVNPKRFAEQFAVVNTDLYHIDYGLHLS